MESFQFDENSFPELGIEGVPFPSYVRCLPSNDMVMLFLIKDMPRRFMLIPNGKYIFVIDKPLKESEEEESERVNFYGRLIALSLLGLKFDLEG